MTITALPTPPSRADAANFSTRADVFLAALPTFVTEANATATQVTTDAAAAAAAATTATTAPATAGTSTTTLTVGTGSRTLTIQTGKNLTAGMWVGIARTSDGTTWMSGSITSYNSGTGQLVVNCQRSAGSGAFSAWTIWATNPMISDTTPRALAAGSTVADPTAVARLIGYLGTPVISVTTSHVLSLADVGCVLEIGAGGSITVPLVATVAFSPGDIILWREMAGSTKSITPASGVTLRQSGTTNTGARTAKAYGEGAIKFTGTADVVYVNGDLT
jgi:hypothetical protein